MRYQSPKSWNKLRFCDVAEVITGTTPPTSDPENYGGELPFITPGDLDTPYPIDQGTATISSKGKLKARIIPKNAVLVCCIGSFKIGNEPLHSLS